MPELVLPRGLGWKKDPPKGLGEKPDYDAREKLGVSPPPKSASIKQFWTPPAFEQGVLGSCVAQLVMQMIRVSQARQGVKNPPIGSRLFCYYVARSYDNDTGNDNGTFIRNAFMGIVKYGFPQEDAWPYSDDKSGTRPPFARMPSLSAYRAAFDQRAERSTIYRRISSTGEERLLDIRRAIASGFPVGFGTEVSVAFVNGDLGVGPIPPPVGLQIAGKHAMMLGEYEDEKSFGTLNSWGPSFGDNGWCKLSSEYIKSDISSDFWIVETAPVYEPIA